MPVSVQFRGRWWKRAGDGIFVEAGHDAQGICVNFDWMGRGQGCCGGNSQHFGGIIICGVLEKESGCVGQRRCAWTKVC